MACPQCKCKVTYYFDADDGSCYDDYDREKCAHCGCIFYAMDADDEDDYYDVETDDCPQCKGTGTYWDGPCLECDTTGKKQY